MRVTIPVTFEVPDAPDKNTAIAAAETASFEYLSFCTATGYNPGRDECEVHVDGHGTLTVRVPS